MMTGSNDVAQHKGHRASRLWEKTISNFNLDLSSFIKMVKFALPPTISLCIFQSTIISNTYTTVGYLIAVGSVLSGVLQPRAVFLQTMMVNVLVISLTTAVATLAMWSAMQARRHTTVPGMGEGYNSSASGVSGVWLFFMIYAINVRPKSSSLLTRNGG